MTIIIAWVCLSPLFAAVACRIIRSDYMRNLEWLESITKQHGKGKK